MFLDNKYTKWYNNIINRRRNQLPDVKFTETHHIIPTCCGGNNSKSNLVILTMREHFIAHLLLVKMVSAIELKCKLSYALMCMSSKKNPANKPRYKPSSRIYELMRKVVRQAHIHEHSGENNPFYGKTHSEETKRKMREKRSYQPPPNLGKPHSEGTKNKLREANRKQFEDPAQVEMRQIKSKALWANPEYREKNSGRVWYHDPILLTNKLFKPDQIPVGWVKGKFKKEVVQ